jgi:alcohol sulfotransferase
MSYLLQTLRHGAYTLRKKASRRLLHWRMRGRPAAEILQAERRLRGEEQLSRLREADVVIVSFGKSGRTWLRVMLSHLFRVMYDLPESAQLGFDNFHHMNPAIPKIFFTHDNYIKDVTGQPDSKAPFYDKRVVLMARDPRDTAVSQFFQWKFRLKPNKVTLNDYPDRAVEIGLFDFVTGGNPGGSLNAVAQYLNQWAAEADKIAQFHLLRYEDLRSDTLEKLAELLAFLKIQASREQMQQAVDYASFENMQKLESAGQSLLAGGRMKPGDKDNPNSYKVRRAKVGGYRDYFTDDEVAQIDRQLKDSIHPVFGYRPSTDNPPPTPSD